MSKGVVMEVQKHSVVLLTPDGQFVTCKKLGRTYELGNEIQYTRQELAVRPILSHYVKPILMIATCLLFFFLFYKPDRPVMAYVSIDINPSIEASITSDLHVKDLTPYNQDGKRIVNELKNWRGKSLQDVLQEILEQSEKDGYLSTGKQVVLTSVLKNKNDASIEQQLEKLSKLFQDKYKKEDIKVILQTTSLDIRDEAEKEGMSVGTFLKNKENQKQEPPTESAPASPQEFSDKSASISNFVPNEFNTSKQSDSIIPYRSTPSVNRDEYSYGLGTNIDHSQVTDKQQSSENKNNSKQNVENRNGNTSSNEKQTEEHKKENESNNNKNNDNNKSDNHNSHPNEKGNKEHG